MTPILAKEMSGAEKKKFMAGYQKAMKNTVGLIGDLEAALNAGDNAKAEEIVERSTTPANTVTTSISPRTISLGLITWIQ